MSKPRIPKKQKQFSITPWTGASEGEKIILYGVTGMGKTTLASLVPDPVFIGLDDGGRKMRHPVIGQPLNVVPGIEIFEDVRAVLQSDVFEPAKTIVIDTITEGEQLALTYTLKTVPRPKSQGSGVAKNIHDYGYHEGFVHWMNSMSLLLPDLDRWVRKGKNILLLAQEATIKWKTSGAEDFLMAAPDLHHSRTASTLLRYMSWADHVFRIEYANPIVTDGKVSPVKTRAVHIQPDATFFAKSRTISPEYDVVEFNEPADDSIWNLLF